MPRIVNRWWPGIALLVLTVAIRGGWLAATRDKLADDPDGYRRLAVNLIELGCYGELAALPTAFRPPLYPLMLAATGAAGPHSQLTTAALHLALGVLTVLLVYGLALTAVDERDAAKAVSQQLPPRRTAWPALLAALLVACDPILLNQSSLVMTETAATFLAVAAWWCLVRMDRNRDWLGPVAAGAVLGLAALCRPTFLVWLAAALLVVLLRVRRRVWWPLLQTALMLLAAAAVLAPWAVRNAFLTGRPVVTTTHGGYTLLLGNNDEFYDHLLQKQWTPVWDSSRLDDEYRRHSSGPWQGMLDTVHQFLLIDELEGDRWAYEQAQDTIRRRPGMFLAVSASRVGWLWSPLPNRLTKDESTLRRMARYAVAGWYVLVYALAVLGVIGLRRRLLASPWLWGLLLVLSFTAMHAVYWSNLRMRAPLMPLVAMLAAAGAAHLVRWLRQAGKGRGARVGRQREAI
jgi:4-amino-4-deoxy-L-arabinose transferase-like glycosyltransferase